MTLRILACQIDIPATTSAAERDDHLVRVSERVDAMLRAAPADLIVLPELSSVDYSRSAFERLDMLAEPLDGPSFDCWSTIARAHNCTVVYGFPRRQGDHAYVTMAVVGPDGQRIGHYDKIHLAQYGMSSEKDFFSRGTSTLVFEVNGFRIAPIICYDIRIPELSRVLTVEHGVELILHCGAYYRDESFSSWHAFVATRAIENQIFFLSLNRAGPAFGSSCLAWPWMDDNRPMLDFDPISEDFRRLQIDRAELFAARANYSFLQDRRESYSACMSGNIGNLAVKE